MRFFFLLVLYLFLLFNLLLWSFSGNFLWETDILLSLLLLCACLKQLWRGSSYSLLCSVLSTFYLSASVILFLFSYLCSYFVYCYCCEFIFIELFCCLLLATANCRIAVSKLFYTLSFLRTMLQFQADAWSFLLHFWFNSFLNVTHVKNPLLTYEECHLLMKLSSTVTALGKWFLS